MDLNQNLSPQQKDYRKLSYMRLSKLYITGDLVKCESIILSYYPNTLVFLIVLRSLRRILWGFRLFYLDWSITIDLRYFISIYNLISL